MEVVKTQYKKVLAGAALVLLLLVGLGLILYPLLSNYFASGEQSAVQAQYVDEVSAMENAKIEAELEAARLYNEALLSVQDTDEVKLRAYDELLNFAGNGVMATLEVPVIDVELPIYHGVGEDVLQKGVGHMPGTSLPIGGASTHAVLSAHAGLPSARLFTDLDQLVVGDQFCIHVLGEALYYEVDQIVVTIPSDTDAVQIVEGKDYVTLLTCTPYGVNTHRLLVRGRRTEIPEVPPTVADEPEQPERASTWTEKYLQGIAFGMAGAVLLIGSLVLAWKIKKNRN
ncbi:MAG: class C sortase [Acutalibacteraceae bacterium]